MLPLLLTALACAPAPVQTPDIHTVALRVEPDTLNLQTGPGGIDPVQFEAWASFDNDEEVLLEAAEWSLSNRSTGTIDASGLFQPSDQNGGITWVTARFDGFEATAEVSLIYQQSLIEGDVDQRLFANPDVSHPGLWTYPADGVNLPRNTPSIEFQWADVGAAAARLHFRSAVTDLTVYTTGLSWTASSELWPQIVASNAGGTVQVELSLAVPVADTDTGTGTGTGAPAYEVWVDQVRRIEVNRLDAQGSIFYWSTSTSGIMEIPYGGTASEYLTPATTGHCVGCHTVSNGRIAFTYDGGNGSLGVKNLEDGTDIVSYGGGYGNFKTFSPDGNYLLSTLNGALQVFDANSGALLHDVPMPTLLSHVDWSPDGYSVVATAIPDAANYGCDWCFTQGNIVLFDHYGDGTFSEPRTLYDAPEGYNAYYPAFSPDGEWIAFNLSTEDSYDDASAELYVMPREGGTPILLSAANQGAGLTNSLPRWGPLPDDDVLWLAFSSKRIYGNKTSGNPQLWVAAFDPARARSGEDPSWSAFWLPGQDFSQNNHIPYWAR